MTLPFYFLVDKSFCAKESTQRKFLSWQSETPNAINIVMIISISIIIILIIGIIIIIIVLLLVVVIYFVVMIFIIVILDNLRIDVYGFIELTKYFLKFYPDYFLSPLQISGSAVETLFGQYKYTSGSKLDAANYGTCRSKYLTKQAVHHSGQFYRDQELNIHLTPLEKKSYNSINRK